MKTVYLITKIEPGKEEIAMPATGPRSERLSAAAEETLPEMLANNTGNRWMSFEHAEVYIRIGPKIIYRGPDRISLNTIQIANISMPEKYQRTGVFTRLMTYIQSVTEIPIFLENVRLDWAVSLIESTTGQKFERIHIIWTLSC